MIIILTLQYGGGTADGHSTPVDHSRQTDGHSTPVDHSRQTDGHSTPVGHSRQTGSEFEFKL